MSCISRFLVFSTLSVILVLSPVGFRSWIEPFLSKNFHISYVSVKSTTPVAYLASPNLLTGILLGGISDCKTPPAISQQFSIRAPEITTATLTLPSVSVLPGELVTAPMTLTLPEGQLYGMDLVLTYDSSVVTPTSVIRGALTADWSAAVNLDNGGEIRVSAAGALPIETGGQLFQFVFQAIGAAGGETNLTITRGDLNEGEIPSDLENGNIRITTPAIADFTASPASGYAPLLVILTNTSTGEFDTCAWDFGDGQYSANCDQPDHTYTAGGVYTISLTVSGEGGTDTEIKAGYITASLLQVTGAIRYWNDYAAIPDVLMMLENGSIYTGVTGLDGSYIVNNILRGSYTLTPLLSLHARGISAYDASLVLQHAASLITLTGYPAQAADVSRNGTISSYDASFILRKSVGLIDVPFPNSDQVWVFDPASRPLANLESNLADQDFTGVLLGDVSGNWPIAVDRAAGSQDADITLSLHGGLIEPNGTAVVQVVLENKDAMPVYSLDLGLASEAPDLTVVEVTTGPLAQDMSVAYYQDRAAGLRLALAGARPIKQSGILLVITFKVTGGQKTELTWYDGAINETIQFSSMLDGEFSLPEWSIYLPVVRQKP